MRTKHPPPLPQAQDTERVIGNSPLPPPRPQAQDTERVNGDIPCVGGSRTNNPDEMVPMWATEIHEADDVIAAGEDGTSPLPPPTDEMDHDWTDLLDSLWGNKPDFEADVIAAGEDGTSPLPPLTDEMEHERIDLLDSLWENQPVFEDGIMRDGIFGMGDDQRDDVNPLSFYAGSVSLDNLPLGGGGDGS